MKSYTQITNKERLGLSDYFPHQVCLLPPSLSFVNAGVTHTMKCTDLKCTRSVHVHICVRPPTTAAHPAGPRELTQADCIMCMALRLASVVDIISVSPVPVRVGRGLPIFIVTQ